MQYPSKTLDRAARAMYCSPFKIELFTQMRFQGVALQAIAGKAGVNRHYTQQALAEITAESQLLWLIQVGLLRREVDGQGLTDSFRLTPLGRQLVEKWHNEGKIGGRNLPNWRDRLLNSLSRWLRVPL